MELLQVHHYDTTLRSIFAAMLKDDQAGRPPFTARQNDLAEKLKALNNPIVLMALHLIQQSCDMMKQTLTIIDMYDEANCVSVADVWKCCCHVNLAQQTCAAAGSTTSGTKEGGEKDGEQDSEQQGGDQQDGDQQGGDQHDLIQLLAEQLCDMVQLGPCAQGQTTRLLQWLQLTWNDNHDNHQ